MPVILGADRSGKSLLAGLLGCSPDVNSEALITDVLSYNSFNAIGLKLLDLLHKNVHHDKYIWLIRNPLESSCSMNKSGITNKLALSYWVDINTIIWYFLKSIPENKKLCVRFEDLLLNDSVVKSVFDFSGIIFNEQYLKYGDFDQFQFNDPVFRRGVREGEMVNFYEHNEELRSLWDNFKNKKIVIQFGYTVENRGSHKE